MRTWVRKAEVDASQRPGTTSEETAEIKRLRAENALMESRIDFYKTEPIKPRRPWHSLADIEPATAERGDRLNDQRPRTATGGIPPHEHGTNSARLAGWRFHRLRIDRSGKEDRLQEQPGKQDGQHCPVHRGGRGHTQAVLRAGSTPSGRVAPRRRTGGRSAVRVGWPYVPHNWLSHRCRRSPCTGRLKASSRPGVSEGAAGRGGGSFRNGGLYRHPGRRSWDGSGGCPPSSSPLLSEGRAPVRPIDTSTEEKVRKIVKSVGLAAGAVALVAGTAGPASAAPVGWSMPGGQGSTYGNAEFHNRSVGISGRVESHVSGCVQVIIGTYPSSTSGSETRTACNYSTKTFSFTMDVNVPGGASDVYVTLAKINSDSSLTWLGSRHLTRP
ncbi:hypothetical protein GCM10010398_16080 [Streptomyces fimbriatus]